MFLDLLAGRVAQKRVSGTSHFAHSFLSLPYPLKEKFFGPPIWPTVPKRVA